MEVIHIEKSITHVWFEQLLLFGMSCKIKKIKVKVHSLCYDLLDLQHTNKTYHSWHTDYTNSHVSKKQA